MSETQILDMPPLDNRGSFEKRGAKEPPADNDFARELFSSLMMEIPEVLGRTLPVSGRAPGQLASKPQVSGKKVGSEGVLSRENVNILKEAQDHRDAKAAEERVDIGALKRERPIDTQADSIELKDKASSAADAAKGKQNAVAVDKGTEKPTLTGGGTKESAEKVLKGESVSALEGGNTNDVKAGGEKAKQEDGGGALNRSKGGFSLVQDGVSEGEGDTLTKGALKEGAFLLKASLQGQANNNTIAGVINNKGSIKAPAIKADMTSPGAGLAQSQASTGTTTAVKSAGPVRSTAFDNVLIRQVSSKMAVTFKNNVRRATLALNPPELGRLKVEIIIENNKVRATIATENVVVRDTLEANLPALREALQAQGLTVDDLNIMFDNSYGGGGTGRWSGSSKRERPLTGGDGESADVSAAAIQDTGNDSLDIFI